MKPVYFERAIFLSWYCSKADCKFCYMSTQKDKIKNPKLARRRRESILAEVVICKALNWKIEFLSGGYHSYTIEELLDLIKKIYQITKQKQWLNIGTLNEEELKRRQRREAFGEKRLRNEFKSAFVQMAEKGELILEDYLKLFQRHTQ